MSGPTSLELCAGGGGQAVGLERAGFAHAALFENDTAACNTLRLNRPEWTVHEHDLFQPFAFDSFKGIDLLAGGLPCPPFSVAGKQLGERDERNLFSVGIQIVEIVRPRAVMFENVKGMLGPAFADYRMRIEIFLNKLGYRVQWKLLQSADFGVPQLRPRVVLVALQSRYSDRFAWPEIDIQRHFVGPSLLDLMAARGWRGAHDWSANAMAVAPTLVGGSKKHGGPDLGPTRARAAWAALGVNGKTIADLAPEADFDGSPRLTLRMAARLQGFPDGWGFWGGKTAAYRQIGNAFPPPVAEAVGRQIMTAISGRKAIVQMHGIAAE